MGKKKDYTTLRARGWTLVLYPDAKNYDFDQVMVLARGYSDYAFIKHDPDVEEKKTHYHLNIFFQNACSRSAVLKKLGLPDNYTKADSIDFVRSINRYLTHIDYPERKQYDIDCVIVSSHYQKRFKKCFDDVESEHDIINKIYYKIGCLRIDHDSKPTILKELLLWCSDNCYENIYKKYRYEFLDYLNLLY